MSRITTNNPIPVAAGDNVYTVLALVSSLIVAIGVLALFLRAHSLGIELFRM